MTGNVFVTKVTKKGTTTIPQKLRETLCIDETKNEKVIWYKEGDKIVLKPAKKFKNPLKVLEDGIGLKTRKSALDLAREAEDVFW